MAVFYSPNGLPMAVKWTDQIGKEALDLNAQFAALSQCDFEGRLGVLEQVVTLHKKVGNPFYLALHEEVALSSSGRSLLMQYAIALESGQAIGYIGMDSWMLLLTPSDDIPYVDPKWTEREKAVLDTITSNGEVGLIRRFIDGPGLNKYFELLRLWLMPVVG